MCRLFAYKSNQKSKMLSLTEGEKSFMNLSQAHPDGWGIAHYIDDVPHVIKSDTTAMNCHLFQKVSDHLSSELVLAHLRKATLGDIGYTNAHPFQLGRWTFAHNGNIKGFSSYRLDILNQIPSNIAKYILGETDSELIFLHIMGTIDKLYGRDEDIELSQLIDAVKISLSEISAIIGDFSLVSGPPTDTYLTFILTNGSLMIGHQGGQPLMYALDDLNTEPPASIINRSSSVAEQMGERRLLFSSEQIPGQYVWHPMQPGTILGIDSQMRLVQDSSLGQIPADPVA